VRRQSSPELARARPKAISEFQSDAVEIEERTPPRLARLTLYCVVALISAAVTWASLSQVDTIVSAPGKLIATTPNVVVQPLETSVIREMHVKVGDIVERGQPLATLDPTFSQADVDQLRTRVSALDAAIARIKAEMDGGDIAGAGQADPDQALQHRLFSERKAFYEASLRNYDAQIASAEANIATANAEVGVLIQRRDTLKTIENIRQGLTDKGLGSRLNLLASHDAILEVEHNLSRIRGSEVDNAHRLKKVQAERGVFIDDFRRTAYQELVDTLAKRSSAAEDLRKAELRRHLIALTAPVDAVVLEIANRSVGSVLREAETLFSLVPRDVPLQAEIRVEGKDIGRVAAGQLVRIKFDAFPFQKYGTGTGTVRVISRDAFAPEAKGEVAAHVTPPYYRILADINDARLRDLPEKFQMIPGMTVTAELNAGSRSVISYFLYPLMRGLDESVREP
jgi:HlyD family secretion protein